MHIQLQNASRTFGGQTVFSGLNYSFEPGHRYAVLGGNGSGKSTLLKVLSGTLSLSSGEISATKAEKKLEWAEQPFRISMAGPYLELIEELGAREFLAFYQKFRPFSEHYSPQKILQEAYLEDAADKSIQDFSSGMKQRLRLALALFTQSEMVLLDEPTSNLDPTGVEWFQNILQAQLGQRTLVVGSNFDERETFWCEATLDLQNFKS